MGRRHERGWTARIIAAFLASLLTGSAVAAERPVGWCYPSGLKIAVIPRDGPPIVGVVTVVEGGSAAERDDEVGAAHLLEHLWFRSPRMGYPTVDDLLDDIGAEANAYTTHDETQYVTVAHRRAIRTLLTAEAQRLRDPLGAISSEVFDNEKRVVQNEIDQRYEGRDPAVAAIVGTLVPEDHPYARSVAGSHEQVGALVQERVRAHGARQYVPSKVSLYVAGDVSPAAVARIVGPELGPELLADPGAPELTTPTACEAIDDTWPDELPLPSTTAWSEVEAGVDDPVAVVAWSVPSGNPMRLHAEAASALMEWQLRKSTALQADCWVVPKRRMNLLMCATTERAGRGEETWRKGLRNVDRLWRQALDKHDSKQDYWASVSRYLRERTEGAGRKYGEVLGTTGFLLDVGLAFHRSRGEYATGGPTAQKTAVFAQEWLTQERMRGLVLRPAQSRRADSAGFHGGRGHASSELEAPGVVDVARLAELVVDPGLDRIDARSIQGRPVWVLGRESVKAPRAAAVFPMEVDDASLKQRAWNLVEDPWDLMPNEVRYGASRLGMGAWMSDSGAWWSIRVDGPDADAVAEVLKKGSPPPFALIPRAEDKAMTEELLGWRREAEKNAGWNADRVRWDALADGLAHPFFDPAGFEALWSIPRSAAGTFVSEHLSPRRARIVAVVPAGTEAAMHKALERWYGVADETPTVDIAAPPNRTARPRSITVVPPDDPGPQAEIALECHVADGDTVDQWVLELVLDDALNDALRNDLGVTYGVYPSFGWKAHGTTLGIETRVPHDAAGPALSAILDAVGHAATSKLESARIDRYKLEAARRTALRWQSGDEALGLLESAMASGYDPGDLGLAERLAKVDAARLAERLSPCPGFEAITVIGDPKRVGPSLDAAGLDWSPWAPSK